MLSHVWSVLCQEAITDAESNNISLINVYERLTIPQSIVDQIPSDKDGAKFAFPHRLVSMWIRDTKDSAKANYRIRLLSPDGKPIVVSVEATIEIKPPKQRMRTLLVGNELFFSRPGIYNFQVQLKTAKNWRTVAKVPLDMVVN